MPVIVNAVLGEHQLVIDIVAFVSKGDFPRSRLGEKQRGKILASWVTRKLRTIAQFSIRENDGSDSQITEVGATRAGTMAASTLGGSSLRNVETQSPTAREHNVSDYTSLPTGISEMPAYETSIIESPPIGTTAEDREDTPTDNRYAFPDHPTPTADAHNGYTTQTTTTTSYQTYTSDHQPIPTHPSSHSTASTTPEPPHDYITYSSSGPLDDASNMQFNFNTTDEDSPPPEPSYSTKPILSLSHERDPSYSNRLHSSSDSGDLFTLPSAQRRSPYSTPPRSRERQNGASGGRDGHGKDVGEMRHGSSETGSSSGGEWRQEAIRQLSFGGGQYDDHSRGGGYGHAL